jgi:hypothetical protein
LVGWLSLVNRYATIGLRVSSSARSSCAIGLTTTDTILGFYVCAFIADRPLVDNGRESVGKKVCSGSECYGMAAYCGIMCVISLSRRV